MVNQRYLYTDKKLSEFLKSLKENGVRSVAVDIEGEFNLHHYGEHLCLVQIYDGREYIIIDPLSVSMDLIRQFFENSGILKIMFDCSGDRTLLFRQYGITVKSIMDLAPAVEILGFEKRNLSSVLMTVLGIDHKQKKKFQRYNWMKRPVDREALNYAVEDVRYLFELKEKLIDSLMKNGLLDEYIRRNIEIQIQPVLTDTVPGVFKRERFKKLPAECKDLFKVLFKKRDSYAKTLNLSPNSVVSNEELFLLSLSKIKADGLSFSKKINKETAEKIKSDIKTITER